MASLPSLSDRLLMGFSITLVLSIIFLLTRIALRRRKEGAMRASSGPGMSSPPDRFLVVVRAHDDEEGITGTVASIRAMNYPAELVQILVIADNCTDRTAERARQAGARVLERFDATHTDKGYALEYVIDKLDESGELDALEALVVVNVDSTMHSDLLRNFAKGLDSGQEWMQCYDCVADVRSSWRTRLMANPIRFIMGVGLQSQNPLGLRGNALCLSIRGLRRVPWKARRLTEDIEYSWTVWIAGSRGAFDREAMVYASMLSQENGAPASQRQRWNSDRLLRLGADRRWHFDATSEESATVSMPAQAGDPPTGPELDAPRMDRGEARGHRVEYAGPAPA